MVALFECRMLNAECIMVVCPLGMILIVCEAHTFILHFEFCITHSESNIYREML